MPQTIQFVTDSMSMREDQRSRELARNQPQPIDVEVRAVWADNEE